MPYTHENGLYYSLAERATEEVRRAGRKKIWHTTRPMFLEELEKAEWVYKRPNGEFSVFLKEFPHHRKISSRAAGKQNP
jgi:hypothetical protein